MNISVFTYKLLLLFLPGIISFLIVDKLTIHKKRSFFEFLIFFLIFGFFCYLSLELLLKILHPISIFINAKFSSNVNVWESSYFIKSIASPNENVNTLEVFITTLFISPLIGLLGTFFVNYKILFQIAHKLKLTCKYGDPDLLSYIIDSPNIESWVVVRDQKRSLIYEGWLIFYSDNTDSEQNKELFLKDVNVYNNMTAKKLYSISGIYLQRNNNELTIEFPKIKD